MGWQFYVASVPRPSLRLWRVMWSHDRYQSTIVRLSFCSQSNDELARVHSCNSIFDWSYLYIHRPSTKALHKPTQRGWLKGKPNQGSETKMWTLQNPFKEDEGGPDSMPRPWFQPKKASVIPPRRKLVKKMMLEVMLDSLTSLLCCGGSHASAFPAKTKRKKKQKKIFPGFAWPGNASSS